MSEPKQARCAIGLLLWQDIDCAIAEYQQRVKLTGEMKRGIITKAVTAYFLHKNGDGEDLKPCKICGGKHGATG